MASYNFEQSNVILMIYKQMAIFVGIVLLFLFGMDTARNYIFPQEWKGVQMPQAQPDAKANAK